MLWKYESRAFMAAQTSSVTGPDAIIRERRQVPELCRIFNICCVVKQIYVHRSGQGGYPRYSPSRHHRGLLVLPQSRRLGDREHIEHRTGHRPRQ